MKPQEHLKDTIDLHERISRIETCLSSVHDQLGDLNKNLNKVMENHLPHLKIQIEDMEVDFNNKINDLQTSFKVSRAQLLIWGSIVIFFIQFAVAYIIKKS